MSNRTIKCPKCETEIEITEVIRHELEAEIKKEVTAQVRIDAIEKVRKEYDAKITSTKEEAAEREKQNLQLQQQLAELMKQLRESKDAESRLKLQFEKSLLEEQDKIKQKAKAETEEEYSLRLAQKDKQLADLDKQLKDAQRKAQQGSQQLQGEIQELMLEEILRKEFIYDEIREVPKGIGGADVVQVVRNRSGAVCGTMVWESKNTKNWTQGWITKLKEDSRTLKADVCILVSSVLPQDIKSFGLIEGVWVCDFQTVLPVALALRDKILAVRNVLDASAGKATKAEIVYDYLISNDFKQRIEVWMEYFKNRREELDKERAYFMKKWEKEDRNIMKVFHNTAGMYGDLQGLVGKSLPQISSLELSELELSAPSQDNGRE